MATRFSRRRMLGVGAVSVAGSMLWRHKADARAQRAPAPYQAAPTEPKASGRNAYWKATYSGGPVDVTPLSPGLPGQHYTPVVVPNGAALPFRLVDGVKVFHVIAEEV